uniref:Uncharacterized protein n=1 Tax=Anguilla anguilla TaxID=7936 RepID=A0A0E9TBY8_ANGAN
MSFDVHQISFQVKISQCSVACVLIHKFPHI